MLSAYLSGASSDRVAELLCRSLPALKMTDTIDLGGNCSISLFEGFGCKATLEAVPDRAWPIEVTISSELFEKQFGSEPIAFGEWICDNLSCTVVVDCGGVYNLKHSDFVVRITRDKLESVLIPSGGASTDESKTTLIRRRG